MSKKILVVEDNPINQELLSEILERLKYSVDVANNGKIAVDLVEKNTYDLVLMDIQMPEMDGIEATKNIRKKFPSLPIVAITASIFQSDQIECTMAGMNGFLSKPYTFDQVKQLVTKFLEAPMV
jgi:CheY-like chemotaxis protein